MANLIGISGKINSGKDLTGEIIQYLNDPLRGHQTFSQWKFIQMLAPFSEYKIKKFADKLKDIVCLLIGCTREQLEDRKFKESELGEDWWFYVTPKTDNPLITIEEYNDLADAQKGWCTLVKLTPRLLLQLLGTDCGRKIIHPNIWVNALFADYKPEGFIKSPANGTIAEKASNNAWEPTDFPKWIITDVRFPNEADAIKAKGGIVVRVNRPKTIKETNNIITDIINNTKNFGIVEHESETALDKYEHFDCIISNDGTIEQLIEKIKEIQCLK